MGRGAWWAAVHGVAKSQTQLSNFTFTFHFHALEKEMATHSSVLAGRIPGTGEPGGLPSMGSHRVRHDWSNLAAAVAASRLTLPKIILNYSVHQWRSFNHLRQAYPFTRCPREKGVSLKHLLKRIEGKPLFFLYSFWWPGWDLQMGYWENCRGQQRMSILTKVSSPRSLSVVPSVK